MLLGILYRLVPMAWFRRMLGNINPWIGALQSAELVGDIRGGDSFSDLYGLKRLLIGSLPGLTAMLLRRRIIYFPQTYGPFHSPVARHLATFLLRRAEAIYCRDLESIERVHALIGKKIESVPVELCPDVAFTMPVGQPEILPVDPVLDVDNRPLIGVNVSGLLYAGGYNRQNMFGLMGDYSTMIGEVIRSLLRETDAHLLLVPHVLGDDIETDLSACRSLKHTLSREAGCRLHILESDLSASQTKGVIGRCDFFIGSRMHACIAALSQGIPAVGLAYSDKFHGVFMSAGVAAMVIDARVVDNTAIVKQCLYWYAHREVIADNLKDHLVMVRTRIRRTFVEILNRKTEPEAKEHLATHAVHPSMP